MPTRFATSRQGGLQLLAVQGLQPSRRDRPVEVFLGAMPRLAPHPLACGTVSRELMKRLGETRHIPALDQQPGHLVREDVRYAAASTADAGSERSA